jgi:hypothetical protein
MISTMMLIFIDASVVQVLCILPVGEHDLITYDALVDIPFVYS